MRVRTFDGGGDTVHDGRLATDIKDRFADSGVQPQSAGENYTKIQTRCSDYVYKECELPGMLPGGAGNTPR